MNTDFGKAVSCLGDYVKKYSAVLFITAYVLLILSRGFEIIAFAAPDSSTINNIMKIPQVLSMLVAIVLAAKTMLKLNKKQKLIATGVLVLFTISGIEAHSYTLIWDTIFIIAAYGIRDHRHIRSSIYIVVLMLNILLIMLAVALRSIGVVEAIDFYRGAEVRESFGFIQPNLFGQTVMIATMAWCGMRWKKLTRIEVVILTIIAIFVEKTASSRTASLGIIITAVAFYVAQIILKRGRTRILPNIGLILLGLTVGLSLIPALLYSPDNSMLNLLNIVLSGRLEYPHIYFENIGIKIFGFDINNMTNVVDPALLVEGLFPIDNVFCRLLIYWGPVVSIVVIYLIALSICRLGRSSSSEDMRILVGLIISLAIGTCESGILDVACNCYILGISSVIFSGEKVRDKKSSLMQEKDTSNNGCDTVNEI